MASEAMKIPSAPPNAPSARLVFYPQLEKQIVKSSQLRKEAIRHISHLQMNGDCKQIVDWIMHFSTSQAWARWVDIGDTRFYCSGKRWDKNRGGKKEEIVPPQKCQKASC